jgi:hypothetical protein
MDPQKQCAPRYAGPPWWEGITVEAGVIISGVTALHMLAVDMAGQDNWILVTSSLQDGRYFV